MTMADDVLACRSVKEERLFADIQLSPNSGEEEVGSTVSDGDVVSEIVIEDINEGDDASDSKYYTDDSYSSSLEVTIVPNILPESPNSVLKCLSSQPRSPGSNKEKILQPVSQNLSNQDLPQRDSLKTSQQDLCQSGFLSQDQLSKTPISCLHTIPPSDVPYSIQPELSNLEYVCVDDSKEQFLQFPKAELKEISSTESHISKCNDFLQSESVNCIIEKSLCSVEQDTFQSALFSFQQQNCDHQQQEIRFKDKKSVELEDATHTSDLSILLSNLNLNDSRASEESIEYSCLGIPDIIISPASSRKDLDNSFDDSQEFQTVICPKRNKVRVRLPSKSPEPTSPITNNYKCDSDGVGNVTVSFPEILTNSSNDTIILDSFNENGISDKNVPSTEHDPSIFTRPELAKGVGKEVSDVPQLTGFLQNDPLAPLGDHCDTLISQITAEPPLPIVDIQTVFQPIQEVELNKTLLSDTSLTAPLDNVVELVAEQVSLNLESNSTVVNGFTSSALGNEVSTENCVKSILAPQPDTSKDSFSNTSLIHESKSKIALVLQSLPNVILDSSIEVDCKPPVSQELDREITDTVEAYVNESLVNAVKAELPGIELVRGCLQNSEGDINNDRKLKLKNTFTSENKLCTEAFQSQPSLKSATEVLETEINVQVVPRSQNQIFTDNQGEISEALLPGILHSPSATKELSLNTNSIVSVDNKLLVEYSDLLSDAVEIQEVHQTNTEYKFITPEKTTIGTTIHIKENLQNFPAAESPNACAGSSFILENVFKELGPASSLLKTDKEISEVSKTFETPIKSCLSCVLLVNNENDLNEANVISDFKDSISGVESHDQVIREFEPVLKIENEISEIPKTLESPIKSLFSNDSLLHAQNSLNETRVLSDLGDSLSGAGQDQVIQVFDPVSPLFKPEVNVSEIPKSPIKSLPSSAQLLDNQNRFYKHEEISEMKDSLSCAKSIEKSVPSLTNQVNSPSEIVNEIRSPVFKLPQVISKPARIVKTMSSEVEGSLLEDEQPPASLLPCSLPYLGQGSYSRDASLDVNQISDMLSDKEEDEQKDFFDDELPAIKKGHMLDEEISKNRSEAGPSTAFDELKGASVTIREGDFNYLYPKSTGNRTQDCRKSVVLKFDPLSNVTGSPAKELANNNPQPDKSEMYANSESEESEFERTLTPISSPTSLPANINVETPRGPGRSRKETLDVQVCHRCKDIEKQHQDKIKELEKQYKHLEERNEEMHLIVVEYEKTISHYVSNTENLFTKERDTLKKEKDDALFHLANMEVAFNDVHSKYEKSKAAIEKYKSNEEKLQASINESAEKIATLTSKYQKLKEHALEKLDEANRELANMKKSHKGELSAQKIINQKLEVNYRSLQAALEQEKRDKVELNKICDSLVEKLEVMNQ